MLDRYSESSKVHVGLQELAVLPTTNALKLRSSSGVICNLIKVAAGPVKATHSNQKLTCC
jgi:hypothetical protein